MAKKNEYTVVIERPLSVGRSAEMIRFLVERRAKLRGYTTAGTVRERRSGESGMVLDKRDSGGAYGT